MAIEIASMEILRRDPSGSHGLHPQTLKRLASIGEIVQILPGMYARANDWRKLDQQSRHVVVARTCAAQRKTAPVFARATAAAIWGIPLLGGYPAIPTECRSRLTGGFKLATSRVVTTKTDFEVVEVGGLLVTAPSRTIIDMALAHPFESALISADHALRANLVTQEQLLAEIDAASGRPGRAAARRVIERASPIPESVGESLSRARFYQLGAPEPILQKSFYDKEGFAGRPDMYFEQADCIGEFDGEGKYRRASRPGTDPADVLVDEKLREDRLRCLVKGFIRWTWKDALKWRPLEEKLRSAGVLYGKPVRLFGLK